MKEYRTYAGWRKDQSPGNRRLIGALERIVDEAAPGLTRTMKWGQGCFAEGDAHKLYIHTKHDHVQLGFYRGATLDDPDWLLRGKGKYVRHVRVESPSDIDLAAVTGLIRQVTTGGEAAG